MRQGFIRQSVLVAALIGCHLLVGCSTAQSNASAQTEIGPVPGVRVPLNADGLPGDFFQPGADTNCSNQIIGYRFVVWLNSQNVAVGFNTSPCFRQSPDRKVDGVLRVLVFDLKGTLKASRDLPYLADGNGEVVADGEAMPGPENTLLVRVESVNLVPDGSQESKSGVRLLDASLKDVAQRDLFLEQTTFVEHDLVTESGSPFGGGHTVSIFGGSGLKEIAHRDVNWPAGTMDRKVGEHNLAFMSCGQELRPGEYTYTNGVNAGAKFRCALNVLGQNNDGWTASLQDGDTASIVGLLADGGVVGQIHSKDSDVDRIVIWRKGAQPEALPWLPPKLEGTIDTATHDLSRYATFATNDAHPCNPIGKVLGTPCDDGGNGRWFIFDRSSQSPIVNRVFPKSGRAALAPDGLHYASFEANELHIYSLTPLEHSN
jgi:hypothetical protein